MDSPSSSSSSTFKRRTSHLRLALHPLLSVRTGLPHPFFPRTLLHYHLLTEAELDSLAHFYHQRTPTKSSFAYPAPVVSQWRKDANIEVKRRRFGRFVGLRGCESPVRGVAEEETMRREMERWVDEKVRKGLRAEEEREMWRSKGFW